MRRKREVAQKRRKKENVDIFIDKRLWEMKGKNKDAETLEFNYYCLKNTVQHH